MKNATLKGVLFALLAGVCWGFSGTTGQFLFARTAINTGWLTTVRLLGAGIILLIVTASRAPASLAAIWKSRRDAVQLIFFGVAGLMAVQYSYMQAIYYSDSGTATAVQYTGEAMLLIYSCVTARRLPRLSETLGLLLALFGIFLLATHGDPSRMVISTPGLVWGLIAALSMVAYTIAPGRLIRKYGNGTVTAYGMLIGGITLAMLLRFWELPGSYSPTALLGMGIIILVGTILGYSIYLQSTVLIGGLKAGLIAAVETVAAPFFSRVWLKTPFAGMDYLGFACILVMVFLISLPELLEERKRAVKGKESAIVP